MTESLFLPGPNSVNSPVPEIEDLIRPFDTPTAPPVDLTQLPPRGSASTYTAEQIPTTIIDAPYLLSSPSANSDWSPEIGAPIRETGEELATVAAETVNAGLDETIRTELARAPSPSRPLVRKEDLSYASHVITDLHEQWEYEYEAPSIPVEPTQETYEELLVEAIEYEERGDRTAAVECYLEALSVAPNSPSGHPIRRSSLLLSAMSLLSQLDCVRRALEISEQTMLLLNNEPEEFEYEGDAEGPLMIAAIRIYHSLLTVRATLKFQPSLDEATSAFHQVTRYLEAEVQPPHVMDLQQQVVVTYRTLIRLAGVVHIRTTFSCKDTSIFGRFISLPPGADTESFLPNGADNEQTLTRPSVIGDYPSNHVEYLQYDASNTPPQAPFPLRPVILRIELKRSGTSKTLYQRSDASITRLHIEEEFLRYLDDLRRAILHPHLQVYSRPTYSLRGAFNRLKIISTFEDPQLFSDALSHIIRLPHSPDLESLRRVVASLARLVFEKTGNRLQAALDDLHQLDRQVMDHGYGPSVARTAESLFNQLKDSDCDYLKTNYAVDIAKSHLVSGLGIGRTPVFSSRRAASIDQARKWATVALSLAHSLPEWMQATVADCELQTFLHSNPAKDDLLSRVRTVFNEIDSIKISEESVKHAFNQAAIVATNLIAQPYPLLDAELDENRSVAFEHMKRLLRLLPDASVDEYEDRYYALWRQNATREAQQRSDTVFEEDMLAQLENQLRKRSGRAGLLAVNDRVRLQLSIAEVHYSSFLKHVKPVSQPVVLEPSVAVQSSASVHPLAELEGARTSLEAALSFYRASRTTSRQAQNVEMERAAVYGIAMAMCEKWLGGWGTLEDARNSLAHLEQMIDTRRAEISSSDSAEGLKARQMISAEQESRGMYQMAILVNLEAGDILEAWSWVQRSKARTLSEELRSDLQIPGSYLESLDEGAQRLLDEEEILRKGLHEQYGVAYYLNQFSKITALRESMHAHSNALRQLLAYRDGIPIPLNDLQRSLQIDSEYLGSLGRKAHETRISETVFVDWCIADTHILLFVTTTYGPPQACRLVLTRPQLDVWLEKYWSNPRRSLLGDECEVTFSEMDNLVSPLDYCTNPGDLLVLSPTGPLHSIPLHALRVGDKPLIERNPIIYSASPGIFAQCVARSKETWTALPAINKSDPVVAAVYERTGEDKNFDPDVQQMVKDSLAHLAEQLDSTLLWAKDVTCDNVIEGLRRSRLFCFYGHCDSHQDDILQQSLRLFDGDLTVEQMFGIKIPSAFLMYMACSSGFQDWSPGDEPLGLVTASLIAGAASVLGNLWPVDPLAGNFFLEAFTRKLKIVCAGTDETGLINLAKIMQETILEIKEDGDLGEVYYWASFVLHGSPLMINPFPPGGFRRLEELHGEVEHDARAPAGSQPKEDDYRPLLLEKEREDLVDLRSLENRTSAELFSGPPLAALSTLSFSDNVDEQRRAADTFMEITEKEVGAVGKDALNPVLHLMTSQHPDVQLAASAALRNLAVDPENQLLIVSLGGLRPLMRQMLNPSFIELQYNALGCVLNLTAQDVNKTQIAKSGALGSVLRLAKYNDTRVQKIATGALLNMTHPDESREQLINAGAIPVLLELVSSPDPEVQCYSTTALSNIATIVALMDSQNMEVQRRAALALRNLACDANYQVEIVKADGLKPLLRLLHSVDAPLILSAAACVGNVSIHPDNSAPIIDSGFLQPLVELLGFHDEEVQWYAISILRDLACKSESNKNAIFDAGVVERIKELVFTAPLVVQSEMAACIAVLAASECLNRKMLGMGICDVIIPLAESPSVEVQVDSAAAIRNLSLKTLEPGTLKAVMRLAKNKDTRVQRNAAGALLNMARSDESRGQLINAGATPVLVELVNSPDPEVRCYSATALCKVAASTASRKLVDLQRSAAVAFAGITENGVREVGRDTLDAVLYLLTSHDAEVQRAASAAIGNLAVDPENKLSIVSLGGLEPLLRQMLSPDLEVQCNAVGCVTNLATHSENRQQLVDAGAIPVLVSLLNSPDIDVQYYCTTALSNIAADAPNRKKLAQTGPKLVQNLVALMDSQNLKVQCQAALALRNLASDYRQIYQLEIVKSDGLKPLLRLLHSSNLPLILSAAACVRNVSIHPASESPIIDSGFLQPLIELLSFEENEQVQCDAISTLRNLAATTERNKSGIVEAGAVERIKDLVLTVPLAVQSEMTACVAVLALSDDLKPQLLQMGICDLLIPLTNSPSVDVQG